MALSMRHSRQSVDLARVSKSLISNAETTLDSLYALQQLSILLHGEDIVHSEIRHYREQLKTEWESTVKLFQEVQGFSSDVELLQDNIGTSSVDDVCEIITDMISTAHDAQKFASSVMSAQSLDSKMPYDHLFGEGERLRVQERRNEENGQWSAAVSFSDGAVCADWNIVDTLDRQLEILGRGRVKLEDLQTAMLGMREAVQMFAQFWSNEATLLSRTLQESLEGKLSMSQQDAVEYAGRWRNYDEQMGSDVNTLLKLCDAVIIEAPRATQSDPPKAEKTKQETTPTFGLPQMSEEGSSNVTKVLVTAGMIALNQVVSRMGNFSSPQAPQATRTSSSAPAQVPGRHQSDQPAFIPAQTGVQSVHQSTHMGVSTPNQSAPFPYVPYVRQVQVRRPHAHNEL